MPRCVIEPPKMGHVVFECKVGNSVCRICDDSVVKTKEEVDAILRHCEDIWYRSELRKAREAAQKQTSTG